MPIKPIDVITMAPKSQEVSQIHFGSLKKAESIQSQLGEKFKLDVEHNKEQPIKTSHSDKPDFRYDSKEKGGNEYHNPNEKKNKQHKEEKNKGIKQTKITKGFDITI